MTEQVPVVPWSYFFERMQWRQGEHVSLIGPTGQGKSTLALALLPKRSYCVALVTKPRDATFSRLQREGWRRASVWGPTVTDRKVLLWPKFEKPSDMNVQQAVMRQALEEVFASGNWCVYVDELQYVARNLGCASLIDLLWLQGRSVGVSLVGSAQRPAWVPRNMYSQATHLFFWRNNDEGDLRSIGGLGGANSRVIRNAVASLERHQVLYVNARTDVLVRTKLEV